MSLVIEQRSTSLTSKLKQATLLDNENDVNNNYSSSLSSIPLIVKLKQQTKAFNTHTLSAMVNENNRLKRSMPNSSTRRPSSPAFNSKQQTTTTTKRSVTIDNNNNDLTSNIEENLSTKRFKQDDLNQSSLSNKVDASVETVSIGLATEPDQLGPCEPGTSVVLEGIVWNETDSGVLVVNVTWRGKTYVGTLLDSTKQDWASPRLTCDSPTSDYDPRSSSKTSRSKRTNAGGNNRCINYHPFQQLSSNSDDRKLRNTIKTRQSKRTNDTSIINNVHNNCSSSSPLTSPYRTNTTFFPSTNNSETQLISCPEAQCYKQFVSIIALNYHLTNTHKKLDTLSTVPIPQANTRDEEDVAHILANVADYVRRPSPRASPEHQRQTTLTWPCPQISSNLVLSSSLNNNEQQTSIPLTTNSEQDIKSTDQFLLHVKDEPRISLSSSSWTNSKPDELNDNKQSLKIPTPPPSSFVPINLTPTIQPPPVSSSPAYSDISDEDPTNDNEKISPSTINLLNDQSLIPNPSWTADMLLQQYGTYMQHVNKELTSNCLNSKPTTPNGTSDSTVKNILDSRCSKSSPPSSLASSSSPPPPTTTNFYNYHPNGIANDTKLSPSILNSLTSPNENLLNPSSR